MHIIPIDKENLPEYFSIDLADETFTLSFAYNAVGDYFTVSLYKPDESGEDEEMILGEKLTLGKPLWSDFTNQDLPAPQLIMLDLSEQEDRITWENFNKTVFLYVNDGEPDDN